MKIHLADAYLSNFWGVEHSVAYWLKEAGIDLIHSDFRKNPDIPKIPCDCLLVLKGERLTKEIIKSYPTKKRILWYGELLDPYPFDGIAKLKLNELKKNIDAYDLVLYHDKSKIDYLKTITQVKVKWLPNMAVDPRLFKKIDIPKKYDLTFVGTMNKRRNQYIDMIKSVSMQSGYKIQIENIWDRQTYNKALNETKIVLNFHYSNSLNTETRIYETLGSGSFLLSEKLSMPDLFIKRKHLDTFDSPKTLIKRIIYYLKNEKKREEIAQNGHKYIMQNHNFEKRIEQLLNLIKEA